MQNRFFSLFQLADQSCNFLVLLPHHSLSFFFERLVALCESVFFGDGRSGQLAGFQQVSLEASHHSGLLGGGGGLGTVALLAGRGSLGVELGDLAGLRCDLGGGRCQLLAGRGSLGVGVTSGNGSQRTLSLRGCRNPAVQSWHGHAQVLGHVARRHAAGQQLPG